MRGTVGLVGKRRLLLGVKVKHIPTGVYERLPVYLNCLLQLKNEGVDTVSSQRVSALTGVNSAAIRRDLSRFGTFGIKGVGYVVNPMIRKLRKILGSDHPHKIILVGAGNLGSAIAHHTGLKNHGFHIAAVFDSDPAKIGVSLGETTIRHIDEARAFVRLEGIAFAIIAVPPDFAQSVADGLIEAGISVILNYTSLIVRAPASIQVHNTDPVKELLITLHNLSARDSGGGV